MRTARAQLGWRTLAGIGLCGVVVGFAIPAIASSLIRRERQQPSVRLLPAPKLPENEAQPSVPGETSPAAPSATRRAGRLGAGKAGRNGLRRLEHVQRAAAGERAVAPAPGSAVAPASGAPSESSAPSQPSPPTSKGGKGHLTPTPVNGGNGGSSAGGTSPGGSHADKGSGK